MYPRERHEQGVFDELLKMVPGLKDRLMTISTDEVATVAELVSTDTTSFDILI